MPSFCKRRGCIPRSQMTCQSLHLTQAELEGNLGLLTLAALSQNCGRVSPFPTTRLSWASQCRNSESDCPWLKFSRNTACWSSNSRQASPSSSSAFIWQMGRITESHCNWGFVRATPEEGGTPYHRLTGEWVSQHSCCEYLSMCTLASTRRAHSRSLGPSSISGSLFSCALGALENADIQTPTQINDNKISWDGASHHYFSPIGYFFYTWWCIRFIWLSPSVHPLPPHHPQSVPVSLFSMSVSPLLWT